MSPSRKTGRLDGAVLGWLQGFRSPSLDVAARVVSALGSEAVVFLVVALALLLGWRRRVGAAAALLLVTVGAVALNSALKEMVQRPRPGATSFTIPAQAFSFPSGHATVAAAFYFFLAYLGWRALRGWPRLAFVGALGLLVVLIGLSRLYLGVHFLSDVLAGYAVGFVWADAVIVGGALLARRERCGRS